MDKEVKIKIEKLQKKVFIFDTSDADEKAFKIAIQNWILHDTGESFRQMLWNIIWLRNDKGKYSKYLYFNENNQKLYGDRDFLAWADLMLEQMQKEIESFKP